MVLKYKIQGKKSSKHLKQTVTVKRNTVITK